MGNYSKLRRVGVAFLLAVTLLMLALSLAPMAAAKAEAPPYIESGGDPAAPAVAIEEPALPEDYFTPEQIGSFTGQVALVVLLAQFLKLPIDRMVGGHIKTEYVVYVIALAGQVLARVVLPGAPGLSWEAIPTIIMYAFAVALVAMKTYSAAIERVEQKKAERLLLPPAEEIPPN